MSDSFSEVEEDFIHCISTLKMSTSDLSRLFGKDMVYAMLSDGRIQAEIAKKRRQSAEELWLKKQIDINTILELRPKALSVIQAVLDDKDHPDRVRVALKILGGEMSMIEAAGKALGEKLGTESPTKAKHLTIVVDKDDAEM